MIQEEILEYNKMCAEFLGKKLISAKDFNALGENSYTGENKNVKWGIIEYLAFHSDWNWIMEVVEAIEKLGYNRRVDIDSSHTLIQYKDWFTLVQKDSKKEAVVQSINQFLIWYKENK